MSETYAEQARFSEGLPQTKAPEVSINFHALRTILQRARVAGPTQRQIFAVLRQILSSGEKGNRIGKTATIEAARVLGVRISDIVRLAGVLGPHTMQKMAGEISKPGLPFRDALAAACLFSDIFSPAYKGTEDLASPSLKTTIVQTWREQLRAVKAITRRTGGTVGSLVPSFIARRVGLSQSALTGGD